MVECNTMGVVRARGGRSAVDARGGRRSAIHARVGERSAAGREIALVETQDAAQSGASGKVGMGRETGK